MTQCSHISGDCWSGALNHDWSVAQASLADLVQAILRLDAQTYTLLTIHGEADCHMVIGGGAGQYVVYATQDNEVFWNLLTDGERSGVVLLNAGGQIGDYPAVQVVDIEKARAAASTFFSSCELDSGLRWTSD